MPTECAEIIDEVLTVLASKYPDSPIIQTKGFAIVPIARGQRVRSWLWKDGWGGQAWLAKLGFRGRRTIREYLDAREHELCVARISDGQAIEIGSDQAWNGGENDQWVERWDQEAQKSTRILLHRRPIKRVHRKKFYVVLARSKKFLVLQEHRTAEEAVRSRAKATYRYLDGVLRNIFLAHGLSLAP